MGFFYVNKSTKLIIIYIDSLPRKKWIKRVIIPDIFDLMKKQIQHTLKNCQPVELSTKGYKSETGISMFGTLMQGNFIDGLGIKLA